MLELADEEYEVRNTGSSDVVIKPTPSAPKRSVAWRHTRLSWSTVGAALCGVVALATLGAPAALADQPQRLSHVIVVGRSGNTNTRSKVQSENADVSVDLPLVNAVATDVTDDQLNALENDPSVVVVPNVPVSVQAFADTAGARPPAAVFPAATGASLLNFAGLNGSGVNVAVLDTGIAPLPDFGSRLVAGVDLSGEGNPFADNYGHGTFVAGLIAGNGASSQGHYMGEAPGAQLTSIKVAGASGVTDLATVISGIQWAVTNAKALNIRVLNISLGAPPLVSSVVNPLDQAVEAAWNRGITVVASAGNAGPFNGTITSPGDDPLVVTAGALDDNGTVSASDDTMTTFSSVGPTYVDGWFKPDLVASGRSVVSLRAPGSTIDVANPTARIGDGNFVGSGTSFSAAITSGAAAILRQADPFASPDKIKGKLLLGATKGPVGNPFVDGWGSLNVVSSVFTVRTLKQQAPANPTAPGSTVSLLSTGAVSSWNPGNWSGLGSLNGSSWNGSSWNGSSWNGSSWNGSSWNGSSWNGSSWNGSSWSGSSWSGSSWSGSSWNGSSWNGSSWN
ncbi:MAG TPA: S8 family peptidase [Acidimicrobiales bacterium]